MEKEPLSTHYCSLQIRAINTTQKQKTNQSPNKQKPPLPPSPPLLTAPSHPNPSSTPTSTQICRRRPPLLPQLQLRRLWLTHETLDLECPHHHGCTIFVDENAYLVPKLEQTHPKLK
ncbi:hypothetical protein RHGRI_011341 [Rhododendron griersonianum]|uniref:Uncharacterized protein n=1 Tax=Rhododendron griersonianum TaxID=479676 RepID=A0AAV6KME4_9ERIC|nr:hypothetical protein RHGRI_011341 [Rhododendron griersonianum]